MAQISYQQAASSNNFSGEGPSVGFFTLKNDGDEAVVRFMHDDTSTFDIVVGHPINIDGKHRKVNCIRDPRDPIDNCPLCKSGAKVETKFFIHLIQYDKDQNGNIVPSAKVWERSMRYADQLASLINEYGPLSDCIFKIRRTGAAGSMDTTYSIMYASPQVYRPEMYPKKPELFEGYKTIGGVVMDRSYEDLQQYVTTGRFPQKQQSTPSSQVPSFPDPIPTGSIPLEANPQQRTGGYTHPAPTPYPNSQYTPVQPTQTNAPWETASPAINRPVRTY